MKKVIFPLVFFFLNAIGLLPAVERVRVDVADGTPRITVDGQAVRARMFFGNPGSRPIKVDVGAQRISFVFQPVESELKNATMHIRFAAKPAMFLLDDIFVEELDGDKSVRNVIGPCRFEQGMDDFNRDWLYWPPGAANTSADVRAVAKGGVDDSAVLSVRLKTPEKGAWPDFHLYHKANLSLDKEKKYRVSFWIRSDTATDLRIAFYRPGTRFTFLGGSGTDFFRHQIEMAGAAGARFVSFSIGLPWPAPGKEVDWSEVDAACRRVVDANPNALMIPRIPMDPPAWWMEANPGEVIQWKGTPSTSQGRKVAAVSSTKYRAEAAARLDALVRHLEEIFGPNLAGYHPCGQNTGEWFYQDTWGPALNGYADADTAAWRPWLLNRYKNDAALRNAWGDVEATLAGAEVPTPELRRSTTGGVFRDIAVEKAQQAVLDFAAFQQDMMVDTVLAFAKTVRDASRGKRLVVFFYGYGFEFAPAQTGPATSGHYALRKALESSNIDILCSPISYYDRKPGGSAAAMSAAESVALAGKLWLYEDDTRTHMTPESNHSFPGGKDGGDTVEETAQMLLRNTGECAIRNFGTWWMDLGASGWFDDPKLWAEMKRLAPLDEWFLKTPTPFRPEVATILDEASMLAVASGGGVMSRPAVYTVREPLARMGTPYGQYLLDDYLNDRFDAKLNVFVAAWSLDAAQRKALRLRAEKRDRVNLWCYAPGFLDTAEGGSTETVGELTGMAMKRIDGVNAWAEPTEIGRKSGLTEGFGVKGPVKPLFAVADAKPEETLAVYSDGSAAVVMRTGPSGETSIFAGPPGLPSSLLRLAAAKAGVHLYVKQDCNVYANGPAVVLHASSDGPLRVDFGKPGRIVDLLDGSVLGDGPVLEISMKRGSTRILILQSR